MSQTLGKEIGPIGFGLMGFTWRMQPCPQEQAFDAMRAALANGCNYWNGGEFYGPPTYNSLVLLERYFEKYPEDADKVVLNIKGGFDFARMAIDCSPEGIRRSLDNCIAVLKGRKKIDMFECARRDPTVPLEETLGIIDREYVQTGKIGGIALSEVSADTIRAASKITKIVAVETELSLWVNDPIENGVFEACHELGIPIHAYSPLGYGMLTGRIRSLDDVPRERRGYPRFQPESLPTNFELVKKAEEIAVKKGCTTPQLAINWILALQRRPGAPVIIPIPGATTVERVEQNAQVINLTDEDMAELDEILAKFGPAGRRGPPGVPVNT